MALVTDDAGPGAGGHLAVHNRAAVVPARREEDAELRVGPRDLPDGALVAAEMQGRGGSEREREREVGAQRE